MAKLSAPKNVGGPTSNVLLEVQAGLKTRRCVGFAKSLAADFFGKMSAWRG
jgi:hypothetical protein